MSLAAIPWLPLVRPPFLCLQETVGLISEVQAKREMHWALSCTKKKISHHGNQLLGSKTERRKPLAMWPKAVCHETFRCRDKGKREWPTRARKRKTHYVTYLNNPFLSLKKKQTCRLPPTCTESALKRTRELRLQHQKLPEYSLSL